MMEEFSIDIWFHYGSFAYGIEATILAYGSTQVTVAIQSHESEEDEEVRSFLQLLTREPKGLLRTELRVYGPKNALALGEIQFPVNLFTDVPPQILSHPAGFRLKFEELRGTSGADQGKWAGLTQKVWSRS